MKILHKILVIVLTLPSFALFSEEIAEKAPSETVKPFSEAELEQILAPIALYPDTVLTHVLIASTYPLEVIQAERWTGQNPDILAEDSVKMVEDKNWDPSVKALVAFPEILKRLSNNLEWTQKLGDAFLADEEKLLASIQALRQRAYEIGSLDKMEKMKVTKDEQSIIIEPVETQVVYVPYYDTRVVYGPWHWSHYPPVYWNYPRHYTRHTHRHSPFYWGPRVHLSFGFFFSSFHWHNRHVVRIPYRHYRPHRYHNRRQVIRHQHASRWRHNPTHRRGVSYRSVSVSNRYSSNRASQNEIRNHRVRTNNQVSRTNQTTYTTRRNGNIQNRSERRQEVAEQRIQRELRNNRSNQTAHSNQVDSSNRNVNREVKPNVNRQTNRERSTERNVNRTTERNVQRRVKPTPPPVKENRNVRREQSQNRERSSSRSSNRSSSRSSSRSSNRSSKNNKKER